MTSTPAFRSRQSPFLGAAVTAAALSLILSGCSGGQGSASGADSTDACDIAPDYPKGPVELIVPWAAGGGTDGVARAVGNQLSAALGTQVNVVNRTGGSGVVGHQAIASASPDGQTLGLTTVEIGMMHWQGLTDLTSADLTAIAQMNADPAGLTVAEDASWETATDLIAHIEDNPGDIVASGTGQGGIWHLALVGMLLEAGMEPDVISWVPSEGAAPALQELVAGGIDLSSASLGENKTMLDGGRAKALAVMSKERVENFPDVPTLGEDAGFDFELAVWRGITGPEGMDKDVVAELECHLEDIAESEEYGEFMANLGLGVTFRGADEFADYMAKDDAQKGEIMEAAGLAK
jgi:tripartite-type tricarboxylate transporter receptor subunit TctC